MNQFDCIVIGAGVAGMTAAIYLKRYHINVLLLEKNTPGGQIVNTPNVENYPGFKSIDGASLALNMLEQVNHLKIDYRYGEVIKIVDGNEKIVCTKTEEFRTKKIVLALGRIPKKLGLPLEDELIGKGISWCATCDGMFYQNQEVGVIGGGNSALEEAFYLSSICSQVHIFCRNKLRADAIVQEKVMKKDNIIIHYQTVVKELVKEKNHLESVIVEEKGNIKKIPIQGLFIYIGFIPDTQLVESLVKLEDHYIVVDHNQKTSVDGIYACGDVVKKELYQLTTAVGEASLAAHQIKNELF